LTSAILLTALFVSLLFFRELEINRHLADRVLELEIRDRLVRMAPLAFVPSRDLSAVKTAEAPSENETASPAQAVGRAHLTEFTADCEGEHCTSHVSLAPSSPGVAQGQLVMVLESEVPKIGTARANANLGVRRRYFIYPGYTTQDELSPEEVAKIEGKAFKFSRVLQTTADFNVGHLLRPIAMNLYLYDQGHTLIQHERRIIETDEEYDH
jgi:hypothetical protein